MLHSMQHQQQMSEKEYVPPQDEDGGDGGEEVPGKSLRSEQPVHLHGAGHSHTQVLVVVGHLLRKHHSKIACRQGHFRLQVLL